MREKFYEILFAIIAFSIIVGGVLFVGYMPFRDFKYCLDNGYQDTQEIGNNVYCISVTNDEIMLGKLPWYDYYGEENVPQLEDYLANR